VTLRVPETFELPVELKVATWRLPVPVAFVNVIPARAERPETLREAAATLPEAVILVEERFVMKPDAPWRYPLAVRLVPDPFVKKRLGKSP